MGSNSYGRRFTVSIIGESHGKGVGVLMDGLPAGYPLDVEAINEQMRRRRPGQSSVTTTRKEQDLVEILSGTKDGVTTGAPILAMIWNKDVDSSKYEKYRWIPRPGHADIVALSKYGGFADYRGSGRFSGRLTAGLVIAGAVARQILEQVTPLAIGAHVREIAGIANAGPVDLADLVERVEGNPVRCYDQEIARKMAEAIEKAREEKDSVGGIIECIVDGIPHGVGEPFFHSVESEIAAMMFSIGGVKGIEFGAGFYAARMRGSEHNDPYRFDDEKNVLFLGNNAGGILGGITTGQPIVFRVAVKPTASIGKRQQSVDLSTMKNVDLEYEGRHDPCIVPRAVPVVEAGTCIVLLDLMLDAARIPLVLGK